MKRTWCKDDDGIKYPLRYMSVSGDIIKLVKEFPKRTSVIHTQNAFSLVLL